MIFIFFIFPLFFYLRCLLFIHTHISSRNIPCQQSQYCFLHSLDKITLSFFFLVIIARYRSPLEGRQLELSYFVWWRTRNSKQHYLCVCLYMLVHLDFLKSFVLFLYLGGSLFYLGGGHAWQLQVSCIKFETYYYHGNNLMSVKKSISRNLS